MTGKTNGNPPIVTRFRPASIQHAKDLQHFGTPAKLPIALEAMYKKHHWQVGGPNFYQLHLLFDKHYDEQVELIDAMAERVQMLGGVSIAMAPDVAEMTLIPRPPRGREEVTVQIARLLHGHEIILKAARVMARQAADARDDGTNDLLVSQVIRTN